MKLTAYQQKTLDEFVALHKLYHTAVNDPHTPSEVTTFIDECVQARLRGLLKPEFREDLRAVVNAFCSMNYPLPDVNGTDKDGNPYREGLTYAWMDGSAATFRNHQWNPVAGLPTATPDMEGQTVTLKEDEYRVLTGGKAQVKNGKWTSVKVKNNVCTPDVDQ